MEIGILILKGIENMNITSKEYYYQLAHDLKICRIVNGMWQVPGGHGYIDRESAIEDMMRYYETGFTTWDLADIW
jgi:aryl-alcohol dehydrogenase-like predicted oxidoreductase